MDRTLLFLMSVTTHEGEDIQGLMDTVIRHGSATKAREIQPTTMYGFNMGSRIPRYSRMHGLTGIGDGMSGGGITPKGLREDLNAH